MAKNVICLEAKRAPKRDAMGRTIPEKYIGVFAQRVSEGTPGAHHYSGTIASTGKPYSKWERESTIVRGFLRWVDVCDGKFGTSIFVYLEGEKFLFRIQLAYDAYNLRQVANYLAGMAKSGLLATNFFNLTYDVWPKKDRNGAPVIGDNGAQIWASALKFGDAMPLIEPVAMFDWLRENGLEWGQIFDPKKNKNIPDPTVEMRYWMRCILKIQQLLMNTENYLPFSYNSICFQPAPHPLGFGSMTEAERETASARYAQIRDLYIFPFGRVHLDADDVYSDAAPSGTAFRVPLEPAPDFRQEQEDWPPRHEEVFAPALPAEADDLPF